MRDRTEEEKKLKFSCMRMMKILLQKLTFFNLFEIKYSSQLRKEKEQKLDNKKLPLFSQI
jgi:hypothetical protein